MTQPSTSALHTSALPSLPLLARGKVRDNYAVGDDRILMVASDRLSAFDVIMGEPIPGKGELLTQMALFWFGWTAREDIHWIVSIIGLSFFAYGAFILFQCLFMYLPLTYPRYAASLFAANDVFRSAFAAGAIIWAHPMYANLGIGRGCSILGGLTVLGCLGVIVLYYFGKGLRARSTFTGF